MARGDDHTKTVLKEQTVNEKEVHQATDDQYSASKMHGSMECANPKVSQGNALAADDLCFTCDCLECPTEGSYPSDSNTKSCTILYSDIVIESSKVKSSNNTRPKSGKEETKRHGYHRGFAFSVRSYNKDSRASENVVVVGWRSGKNHKDKSSAAKLLNLAQLLDPRRGHFFHDIGAKHQFLPSVLHLSNGRTRFQLSNNSSRSWFSSMEMQIQLKETEGLVMNITISAEIYACLTLKTGWKASESTTNHGEVNRELLPKINPCIRLPQIYILQTAQQYGIAVLVGIYPSSECDGSKNLILSKVVLLVLGHFSFDIIKRNDCFPPPSSQNADVTSREKESSDDASIKFTISQLAEVLNQQLPPRALQDVNTRIETFRRLGNSLLPTQNLARHGFFCNDNNKIQCHRLKPVASDLPGRISDDVRDPPGQQSIYIPPVPSTSSRRSLAQAGYFFTGFFDRVKCFACGRTVQEWVATDNPADQKWHKDDCPFVRGENCGNVPIATHFNQLYGNLLTRPVQGNPGEEVIQQRDPVTGSIIRPVRYPADLPERIRQTGETCEIGPKNEVTIQSGPGTGSRSHGPGLREAPARLPATPLQQAQHQPMRHWRMANVISADHKRFLTNLYLNRELDRVASFARWPTGRPNVAPAALSKTGFFYLGDMDRTLCFSCGGVFRNWTAEDDAASEHQVHFPNCRLLLGAETRNVPVPDLPVATDVCQRDFPCRFPSNPHMRSEAARVQTFDQRWPRNRTDATPAEIAQAGFLYLGERDRVKCWYCNGGLQHWEYDDVPWIEHAKWFPNCQFLLSVKGQHFVYRHLAMCPQLPRPIITRQDGSPLDPGSEQQPSQPSKDIPPSVSRVRQPSPPPTIIDPQRLKWIEHAQRFPHCWFLLGFIGWCLIAVIHSGAGEPYFPATKIGAQVQWFLTDEVNSRKKYSDIYGSVHLFPEDVMAKNQKQGCSEFSLSTVFSLNQWPFIPSGCWWLPCSAPLAVSLPIAECDTQCCYTTNEETLDLRGHPEDSNREISEPLVVVHESASVENNSPPPGDDEPDDEEEQAPPELQPLPPEQLTYLQQYSTFPKEFVSLYGFAADYLAKCGLYRRGGYLVCSGCNASRYLDILKIEDVHLLRFHEPGCIYGTNILCRCHLYHLDELNSDDEEECCKCGWKLRRKTLPTLPIVEQQPQPDPLAKAFCDLHCIICRREIQLLQNQDICVTCSGRTCSECDLQGRYHGHEEVWSRQA